MKIAIMIQCHANPKQINLLLQRLRHPAVDCFVHIDKNAAFTEKEIGGAGDQVFILPDELRVSVEWGQISQVEATLNMLRYAREHGKYDFYWLISGQDWPLRPMNDILMFFEDHRSENFMLFWNSKNHGTHQQNNLDKRNSIYFPLWMIGRKLWQKVIKRSWVELSGGYNKTYKIFERPQLNIKYYFGSSWWALNRETVGWILDYLAKHKEYYQFYQNSTCPDESFFQTLVMLSPYANENTDYLTYLRFQKGANSPDILQGDDFQKAVKSKYLIMRKVDMNVDDGFLTC